MFDHALFKSTRSVISFFLILSLLFGPNLSYAQSAFVSMLPEPGKMVGVSPVFTPVLVKGLVVHPDKPLNFDFIVDSGNDPAEQAVVKAQSEKIVRYFLAALTVPEEQLWVNLSPYEKDRIIDEGLGQTVLGRDMLAQDYVLKQLTASLIYPEDNLGKDFWARIYKEAQDKFGTRDIPVDTFNKVWIVPQKAVVFEKDNAVYVTEARLKVMLDSDYVAMQNNAIVSPEGEGSQAPADLSKALIREVILPAIEKEVNEGKNFSILRQIYHAAILAKWYRELVQDTLMSKAYVGQNKISGVNSNDKMLKEQIYQRYIAAYKQGVFDYIKEEVDQTSGESVPRKYFSGGLDKFGDIKLDKAQSADDIVKVGKVFQVDFVMDSSKDMPMGDLTRIADILLQVSQWYRGLSTIESIGLWTGVAGVVGLVGYGVYTSKYLKLFVLKNMPSRVGFDRALKMLGDADLNHEARKVVDQLAVSSELMYQAGLFGLNLPDNNTAWAVRILAKSGRSDVVELIAKKLSEGLAVSFGSDLSLSLDDIAANPDVMYKFGMAGLNSSSWQTREWAARILGRSGLKEAVDPLVERLNDRDYGLCFAAARALKDMNWRSETEMERSLYSLILNDLDYLLRRPDVTIPELLKILEHPSYSLQHAALKVLRIMKWQPLIKDEQEAVFQATLRSLSNIYNYASDYGHGEMADVLQYLVGLGDRRAIEPVVKLLDHSDFVIKNLASDALHALGDPRGDFVYYSESGHFTGTGYDDMGWEVEKEAGWYSRKESLSDPAMLRETSSNLSVNMVEESFDDVMRLKPLDLSLNSNVIVANEAAQWAASHPMFKIGLSEKEVDADKAMIDEILQWGLNHPYLVVAGVGGVLGLLSRMNDRLAAYSLGVGAVAFIAGTMSLFIQVYAGSLPIEGDWTFVNDSISLGARNLIFQINLLTIIFGASMVSTNLGLEILGIDIRKRDREKTGEEPPSGNGRNDSAQNGGIDIQNIDVNKSGNAKIRFDDDALKQVLGGGFDGFTPVFIKMTPVDNPLMIFGGVGSSR